MLKSNDFRVLFLGEFTKHILESTETYLKLKIKNEVKKDLKKQEKLESQKTEKQKKDIKNIVKYKFERDKNIISDLKEKDEVKPIKVFRKKQPLINQLERKQILKTPSLKIEEMHLPHTVKDVKPKPSKESIDLEKLNPLAKDPLVKVIESQGKNQKIIVKGHMGRKTTPIILNENEIKSIIRNFSEKAKIPFEEGFFKAAVGDLIISAIISDKSKFIIKKMS